jgi:riboflavin synthase
MICGCACGRGRRSAVRKRPRSATLFTGIVQDVGRVLARESRGGDERLTIACERLDLSHLSVGDSVSVQGCCLTAIEIAGRAFSADLSRETLSRTTLGALAVGSPVNLEPALRAGDPLGGHFVSGHVDGIGRVAATVGDARSQRVTIEAPVELLRYFAPKGSVAVDGVSLTINTVDAMSFGVNLIPHTLAVTTLGALAPGSQVNLEIDQVARYVARLLEPLA